MYKLAAKYIDSFRHLTALYYITTQFSRKDAAALASFAPHEFAQVFLERHYYRQPVVRLLTKRPSAGRFTMPHGSMARGVQSPPAA